MAVISSAGLKSSKLEVAALISALSGN